MQMPTPSSPRLPAWGAGPRDARVAWEGVRLGVSPSGRPRTIPKVLLQEEVTRGGGAGGRVPSHLQPRTPGVRGAARLNLCPHLLQD